MASSIGNGGFQIPNHSSKVGLTKPAAFNLPTETPSTPGDSSEINFANMKAPAFKPANEKAQQIDIGANTGALKAAPPARPTSHVPVTMAMGDVGVGLLGDSKEVRTSDFINNTRQFIADGKLQGVGGMNYQASFVPGNATIH
jgi:hypothetical protein